MVKIILDNREIEAEEGTTVLEAARRLWIPIPTLCDHPAIEPYGACRLCMVEIGSGERSRLATACTYPVREGLRVTTDSARVLKARAFIIELLLSRCPDSVELQAIASGLGVVKSRFPSADESRKCIICGLCVRVCGELIGAAAIGFIHRGTRRVVETPFRSMSDACIGCGACAFVCPTGAVALEDREKKRALETWHTELERARCAECGEHFATVEALDRVKKALKLPADLLALCGRCRRKKTGRELIPARE